jgi:peptide/nickel transport system substrate-binding protein
MNIPDLFKKRFRPVLSAGLLALGIGVADAEERITFGLANAAAQIDPHRNLGARGALSIIAAVYSALTSVDAKGSVVPDVALSWRQVEPTIWEFKLRPDVVFTDGTPLDAAVVKWNLERILDENNKLQLRGHFGGNVLGAEVVDAHTVRFKTKVGDANLPQLFSLLFLLSPEWAATRNPAAEALGTGPYTLESYDPQTSAVVVRNEKYYGPRPYYDAAEFKYLTSDAARVTAVQAGEVDIATLFDPQNIPVLKATAPDYEISAIQSSRPIALTFSPNEPALQDVRIRRAIAHGIDVKAITDSIFFGLTEPLPGQVLTPPYPYHNDALKPYAYDPELSKKLLVQAGYPDGIDLSFEFRIDGAFLADRSVVQAIIDQLALAGVRVKPKPVTWAEYNRNVAEGKQGSFALTGGNPPEQIYTSQLQQSARDAVVKNPHFEELLAKLRGLTDPADIQATINQATQVIYDDASIIYLYAQPTTFARRNGIEYAIRTEDYLKPQDAGPQAK